MRKELTYGMASMHKNRMKNAAEWREKCYNISEKMNAQFYEEKNEVFCKYFENGKTKTVKIEVKWKRTKK